MSRFKLTEEQRENLLSWKTHLSSDRVTEWSAKEDAAAKTVSAILNSAAFKSGQDLSPAQLDNLFVQMKSFSANRNLSNLLYKKNGIGNFNSKLRDFVHGANSFAQRLNTFLGLESMGPQTASQFLIAVDSTKSPLITQYTKDILNISSAQDELAHADALTEFEIRDVDKYLDRTLDYLRDFIIYRAVKEFLNVDKYTLVNSLLWIQSEQYDAEEPDPVPASSSSVSLEADLRDHLAENPGIIERGLTLIGKEYDAKDAGRIDLLCKDRRDNYVVVELKKGRTSDRVVGQIHRYIGWVKKNLGKKVRGIIIVNTPDEHLNLAVYGNNSLELRYYQVNFRVKSTYSASE